KQAVHCLLTNKTTCKACDGKLAWKRGRDYGWCRQCRVKIRPKARMWFRGSKLTYRQMFVLLYCWQQRQSPGAARVATGLSYTTVRRWYGRFRWLVPLEKTKQLLSGIVEVDEAWFGKRKFGGQTIVMGAIERDTGRLKLASVPDTERDSLEGFVEDCVAKGTLVVTDAKTGYNSLESLGYSRES
ncbi:MAG: transposase, partial [Candidatus Binatia bacterium]